MKSASTHINQLILPLAIAAFSVALAFGILHLFGGVARADAYLFSQLITGTSTSSSLSARALPWFLAPWFLAPWFLALLTAVFTVTAAWAGCKLGPRASLVAFLQLTVLALLCQWAMWNWYSISSHPLALFVAMTAALFAAKAARGTINHGSDLQTRSYELMLRNLELKKTRLQIVHQDEAERRLLAADLHDQVLNDLKMAKQKLADFKEGQSSATTIEIENRISAAMEEIHEVMDHLCPSVLEHLGLRAAVDELLEKAARSASMKKRLSSKVADEDLSTLSTTALALLYRLIQESINNACKHSNGKTLSVNMDKQGDEIIIRVADDGKGIDLNSCRNGDSRGIRYMKQRANLIGAKIAWHHNSAGASDGGTVVEIRLPCQPS
jgi:signal transduction histidine kinase